MPYVIALCLFNEPRDAIKVIENVLIKSDLFSSLFSSLILINNIADLSFTNIYEAWHTSSLTWLILSKACPFAIVPSEVG